MNRKKLPLGIQTFREIREAGCYYEDSTSHGRLDMAVRFDGRVYLFELKVVEMTGEGAALGQLKERGYAEKYRGRGEPIHLVGVEFSRETRNIVAFEVEHA